MSSATAAPSPQAYPADLPKTLWSARLYFQTREERDLTRPCVHWVIAHPSSSVPFLVRGTADCSHQSRGRNFRPGAPPFGVQLKGAAKFAFFPDLELQAQMYLWFTCALCKNHNRYRSPAPHAPEAVPIHIPAMPETDLARPPFRSSVLAASRRVSEPSPKTWPRRGNGWNSNERDDPVVSWINDCDCVICRVDCVEQTG